MIELLVVMAIIVILAGITIPVLTSGGGILGRAELPRTSEIIHSKIQAAQIYANTYHVKTAVVYSLDNWISPEVTGQSANPPVAKPLVDSIFDQFDGSDLFRRAIVAAAVMYELPAEVGDPLTGKFVPIASENGNFESFPGDHVILLQDPYDLDPRSSLYAYAESRYLPSSGTTPNELITLGMTNVKVITGDSTLLREDILDNLGLGTDGVADLPGYVAVNNANFPAHVFSKVGRLEAPGSGKERFIIHAAASPEADPSERVLDPSPDAVVNEWLTIPIEIYRSTGRVRIAR